MRAAGLDHAETAAVYVQCLMYTIEVDCCLRATMLDVVDESQVRPRILRSFKSASTIPIFLGAKQGQAGSG